VTKFLVLSFALIAFAPQRPAAPANGGLDTAAINRALARTGAMQPDGTVYKVPAPRSDLKVTVNGIAIKPGLALGSWMAFKKDGAAAVAHGDLVLLEKEVNPVISALQQGGMEITAIHNHLLGASPSLLYVHFWGHGSESQLAQTLAVVLKQTATPAPPASPTPPDATPFKGADELQAALGRKGTVANGVLAIAVPRPEKISMMGVELPPSMGMATSLNFQATEDGRVAGTGDFVMLGEEVNKVAKALRDHGIDIAALHSHMIDGTPSLYFMHFWAVGPPDTVGAGLKAALAVMKN
jgi:biotin operon repressor